MASGGSAAGGGKGSRHLSLDDTFSLDSFLGLILLYTAFNLPYVIWMMRGYIEDIPLELEESALVDGCTRFEVLRKVVFPMARAGLFATAMKIGTVPSTLIAAILAQKLDWPPK